MIIMQRLLIPFVVLAVSGCSSAPPIQVAANSKSPFDSAVYSGQIAQLAKATQGEELYRAYYEGGSGFVSLSSVRNTVEEMATKHCSHQNRSVRLLQERTSTPPHVLGNFPRVEWVFECVPRPSQEATFSSTNKLEQLERLKKLLDSGALTQQEFDREKSKLLSAP
ncbi:MAG: SHOCT domain-containing protein [Zoogloeaceae bacterium]|uniref:SHOCT domain-containing protein n=1 Tax=Denitromonas sp. TaxID=2734609 RepID=UPI002FDC97A9|nr:SHOCT domain-containing protein [Zoogloeaceae bacterium]